MLGLRSIQPPDEQNAPVLSALKDCTASGALPPRIAAMILSSLTAPTVLTVMFGCALWNAATASLTTPSSRCSNPTQNVMVTGSWLLVALDPPPLDALSSPPPPHAPSASVTSTIDAVAARLMRPLLRRPEPPGHLVS